MTSRKYRFKHFPIFEQPRTRAVRAINDIHVLNVLSSNALLEIKDEIENGKRNRIGFSVPGIKKGEITLKRRKEAVLGLLDSAVGRDLYKQSIIHMVAVVEDYLTTSLRTILELYPEKLNIHDKKIDLSLVLRSDSLNQLITRIVDNQIHSVFYATPEEYFEYVEKVLSVIIDDAIKREYIEIKASRDLLVHNAGIINAVYIRKAKNNARGKEGDALRLDSRYFDKATASVKKLIETIFKQLCEKYGNAKISEEQTQRVYALANVFN